MRLKSQQKSLLFRSVIFFLLFLILSGTYGSWIVRTPLLYKFGFFIYGNVGKVVLFSVIVFAFLTKGKLQKIKAEKFSFIQLPPLLLATVFTILFPFIATTLLHYTDAGHNLPFTVTAHLVAILIPFLLLIGIFGDIFLIRFIKQFFKELLLCLLIATISYISIFQIWQLWPYFSGAVLTIVSAIFHLTHRNVAIIPPRTLFVDHFAVTVDQACSGLESFLLFTMLFLLIAYGDRKRLLWKKFAIVYTLGMLGLFFINTLRVYLIIWSGLIFSPELAATLFHTYLGLILFLLYFVGIMKFTLPHILQTKKQKIAKVIRK